MLLHNYTQINTKVHVCTRNGLLGNTFDQKSIKIYRSKNKKSSKPLQNNSELLNNDNFITIGTQTNQTSNIDRGTEPLDPNWAKNIFDNPETGINPLQLANLHKAKNKHFIAEAIKLNNRNCRIRKTILYEDWLALKPSAKYWHTLQKDLSDNETGCILYDGNFTYHLEYETLLYIQCIKTAWDRLG